jgi:hypothetical protein
MNEGGFEMPITHMDEEMIKDYMKKAKMTVSDVYGNRKDAGASARLIAEGLGLISMELLGIKRQLNEMTPDETDWEKLAENLYGNKAGAHVVAQVVAAAANEGKCPGTCPCCMTACAQSSSHEDHCKCGGMLKFPTDWVYSAELPGYQCVHCGGPFPCIDDGCLEGGGKSKSPPKEAPRCGNNDMKNECCHPAHHTIDCCFCRPLDCGDDYHDFFKGVCQKCGLNVVGNTDYCNCDGIYGIPEGEHIEGCPAMGTVSRADKRVYCDHQFLKGVCTKCGKLWVGQPVGRQWPKVGREEE